MHAVRRRLLAVSLSLAVPIGALCSPLVHVHPDDQHDDHHASGRVHAHLSGHNLDDHARDHHGDHDNDHHGGDHESDHHDSAIDDHDTRAVVVEPEANPEQVSRATFFVAVQVDDLIPAGLQSLGFTLPAPLESIMRRPPAVSHAHDPPPVSPSSPRAPPARLS